MQIKPKKFVYYVERKPHWLSNRQGYFTMERMKELMISQIFYEQTQKEIQSFDLRTYPDTHLIYDSCKMVKSKE